jgi:endonuclease/exonuclease/phosphatase family metal-dependent hydrolase
MDDLLRGNFAPSRLTLWPPRSICVVDWNIDRGAHLSEVIDYLKGADADLLLLQEADLNARRTKRLNVAEAIARALRMNYIFGREFEELIQGSRNSPAYHGQVTLSRWPITSARILRFHAQSGFWRPRWWVPTVPPFQERLGGRIALVTEVDIGGKKIITYNLHLESRGGVDLRLRQLQETLLDAAGIRSPVLIAGDLNFDASADAPAAALTRAGFRDVIGRHPTHVRILIVPGRPIDRAFVRGSIEGGNGEVHSTIKGSDHFPLSFDLTLR